jgi:glutathione synthase/RimK-type ligase-like ATP-grasp enzyme
MPTRNNSSLRLNDAKIILVGHNGYPSMKELVKSLNPDKDLYLIRFQKTGGIKLYNPYTGYFCNNPLVRIENSTIIRWGTQNASLSINSSFTLNQIKAMSMASNKLRSRLRLMEANVPVPLTVDSPSKITEDMNLPLILRPLKHSAGNFFYLAKNKKDAADIFKSRLNNEGYISEFYPKTREFRIHCAHGKILFIKEKPAPENKNEVVWNFAVNQDEWHTIDRKDYNFAMCKIALDAVKACELDFGAVDIMTYPTTSINVEGVEYKIPKGLFPDFVVCEINTAPSLTEYGIEKYSKYFDLIFKDNTIKHWDYSKFTAGESLSWKNTQLKKEEK